MSLNFPNIDPVIFTFFGFPIRWYSLAYIAGIFLGYYYIRYFDRKYKIIQKEEIYDSLITYSVLGIILGGRIFYVLFYNLEMCIRDPLEIFKTWHGGMSFHGGFIGMLISMLLLSKKYNIKFFDLMDLIAGAAPIGLFFGRIANFINAELYGRVTNVPWAVIFPGTDGEARHPSQIYEALTEGLLNFIILFILLQYTNLKRFKGFISGVFLLNYSISRIIIEYFREPDAHIGLIFDIVTMGQILTLPMVIAALIIKWKAIERERKS